MTQQTRLATGKVYEPCQWRTGAYGSMPVNPPWHDSYAPIDAPDFCAAGSMKRIEWTNHIDLTTLMWIPTQSLVYREAQ